MRLIPAKRGAVALAAALSVVLLLATPAAANTVPLNMATGVISIAGNVFDLTTPGPCPEKPDTVAATFNAGGTWSIAGGWSSQFQLGTPPSGQWYQADFTILLNTGNTYTFVSGGPPWTYSVATTGANHVIFQMRIYRIAPGSCVKTDLACIITFRMSFTGTLTSTTALPTYTPGGMTLNGTLVGTSSGSMCTPPFTPWPGQPISLTLTF